MGNAEQGMRPMPLAPACGKYQSPVSNQFAYRADTPRLLRLNVSCIIRARKTIYAPAMPGLNSAPRRFMPKIEKPYIPLT
jgi:hypothetical protein